MIVNNLNETEAPQNWGARNADDQTIRSTRARKTQISMVGDTILGRFKVLAVLGRGAMGIVYKCFDETSGTEVAIKALPPELVCSVREIENIKANFQLVHNLHHPNIASLKFLEQDQGTGNYYLIMEYVPGITLTEYMKNNTPSHADQVKILSQIATALDFVHSKRLIHRDIKPDNIMITFDGDAKILDFGIAAKLAATPYEQTDDAFCGTAHYIAPELWFKNESYRITSAVDRYSLGVIVFEWVYGKRPFTGASNEELKEKIAKGNIAFSYKANIHKWLVLKKALAKNPEKRYATCTEFINNFFTVPWYLSPKFLISAAGILAIGIIIFCIASFRTPSIDASAEIPSGNEDNVVNSKKSPRLLIKCRENIRNLKTDNLSQGLLQELALSYGFQTINPEYVKDKSSYDFVIDVRFSGAYRLETFSFNKNLKLHAFSLGGDMSATYPNGNLIAQVTLPSKDFRIGRIGDPQEALRESMRRRIVSKEDTSFHNILLNILSQWGREIKQGMAITITLENAGDMTEKVKKDILTVLQKKNLLSDFMIRSQDANGNVMIDVKSKMQSMDIANLFVILSNKKLKIKTVEYGKIILERK